jgi:hypothetical protein
VSIPEKGIRAGHLDSSAALSQKTEVLNAVDSLLNFLPKPAAVPNINAALVSFFKNWIRH